MPQVKYNNQIITYTFLIKNHLKYHYISVDTERGVVLKGRRISKKRANQLILKKAKWILKKIEHLEAIITPDIGTGSIIPYFGINYPVEIIQQNEATSISIKLDHGKFSLTVNPADGDIQQQIRALIDYFYHKKSIIVVPPKVESWAMRTGLRYNQLKFRKKKTQWGSCTFQNNIILNTRAMKLSPELIDYLIVHELCHTKVKNHSKEFYAEVSKHLPEWKELNKKLKRSSVLPFPIFPINIYQH